MTLPLFVAVLAGIAIVTTEIVSPGSTNPRFNRTFAVHAAIVIDALSLFFGGISLVLAYRSVSHRLARVVLLIGLTLIALGRFWGQLQEAVAWFLWPVAGLSLCFTFLAIHRYVDRRTGSWMSSSAPMAVYFGVLSAAAWLGGVFPDEIRRELFDGLDEGIFLDRWIAALLQGLDSTAGHLIALMSGIVMAVLLGPRAKDWLDSLGEQALEEFQTD